VIYVLSGSRRETARWAQSQGHTLRQARHVYDAQTLPGRIAGVRFVQLPGFETRRDRHAIVARLKRSNYRNIEVERWIEHQDQFGGWERHPGDLAVAEIQVELAEEQFDEDKAETAEHFANQDETLQASVDELAEELNDDEVDPLEQFLGIEEKQEPSEPTVEDADPEPPAAEEEEPVKAHEVVEVVQPVEAEESKPKRTRRNKEQMAYDAALADWEGNGGSLEAVIEARDALAKRCPDDERLLTAPQSDDEVEAQAEDDDALDF
jgi:hypothetical protein